MPEPAHETAASTSLDERSDSRRRDFFAQCFRGMLGPLARLLEHRVRPLTQALEGPLGDEDLDEESAYDPDSEVPLPVAVTLFPPGAKPPAEFAALCSRCGKCVEVCPVQCIQIDPTAQIADGWPYIAPATNPCVVCEELACMKACPTGALTLVDKFQIRMGLAEVDHQTCLRHHGEDCRQCLEACPIGSAAIVISGTSGRVLVKSNGCVGCGMCEQACPTHPAAITVHPLRAGDGGLADE
jgi:MauM/NapG family ferredoxin protein